VCRRQRRRPKKWKNRPLNIMNGIRWRTKRRRQASCEWYVCNALLERNTLCSIWSNFLVIAPDTSFFCRAVTVEMREVLGGEEFLDWKIHSRVTQDTHYVEWIVQLCVSMILDQDRVPVQGDEDDLSPFFGDSPASEVYEESAGYIEQPAYDEAFKTLLEDFLHKHWDMMKVQPEKGNEGKRIYIHSGIEGKDATKVEVLCGDDHFDGLWYQGPVKIVECDSGETVWDIEEQAKEMKLWVEYQDSHNGQTYKGFRTPWRICGQYADLERWMFAGIGMTTYTVNSKDQLTLWSQQDTSGALGLTDREKMRLRSAHVYVALCLSLNLAAAWPGVTLHASMPDKLCSFHRRKPRARASLRRKSTSRKKC